jgi:hypothetical protein
MGGPPALGFYESLTTPYRIKKTYYEIFYTASDLDKRRWQALVNTKMNLLVPQMVNFLTS